MVGLQHEDILSYILIDGNPNKRENNDARRTIPVGQEEEILVRIAENNKLSTRRLSATMGMSQSCVWRILHKEKFHPYHVTPVQNLLAPGACNTRPTIVTSIQVQVLVRNSLVVI
ncbi:hypothetical protein ABEB36_000200 [Hypothenemus hampei]|uniref:Uncharacterized protein n=1 Tax=Hypothenemus hampei TaxID=57062 RepID=A0ABD1FDP1_HYPHA